MRAPNIYQKPCPACGALASTGAQRCDCGYSFEPPSEDALLPEEQALQEEELFEAYLAARINQMVASVEAARVELATDPTDQRKVDRLLQAVQDALMLRHERDAQAVKTEQARQAAQAAREEPSPTAIKAEGNTSPDTPVQSTQPTEAFRAQQVAKATKVMEAFENTSTKECPHCKTVLPVTSALCLCGYIFARNDFLLPRATDVFAHKDNSRPK